MQHMILSSVFWFLPEMLINKGVFLAYHFPLGKAAYTMYSDCHLFLRYFWETNKTSLDAILIFV